jgi:hypothetical protein
MYRKRVEPDLSQEIMNMGGVVGSSIAKSIISISKNNVVGELSQIRLGEQSLLKTV